jgi:glycosyltransferase involved in cell wall biosynthesis
VKKRILQLIPSFHSGGSERQAITLTRKLRDGGSFDVLAATLNREGILLPEFQDSYPLEIPEYRLTSFYDRNFIRQVRGFEEYLKENAINLIHTHDFYTNVFGMAAAMLARTPVRITSKRESEGLRSRAQDVVEKIAFGRSDAVLVNSKAVADHLVGRGISRSKLRLIYNGTDMERFDKPLSILEVGLPDLSAADALRITLVANLRHRVKNIPMFLRVAERVGTVHPDVHFVIAGEGELEPELKSMAGELAVADRILFIGRCDDVPALLRSSYACVLTSTAEGFSNSLVEYMAAGKPVVATDVGGAREAIDDTNSGYLVDPDDDATMAEKLIELLNDENKANKMGAAGKAIAIERFSVTSQITNVSGLYEELLAN